LGQLNREVPRGFRKKLVLKKQNRGGGVVGGQKSGGLVDVCWWSCRGGECGGGSELR